jgi:hypothetical protein
MIIRLTIALRIYGRTVGTRGRGVRGSGLITLPQQRGGDYTHHITTPPDFQTFLRPCNGQCNGEWKDEMQRYLSFRCWVLHYNGVKFFLVEHSYLYVSWIWNTFFFHQLHAITPKCNNSKETNFISVPSVYLRENVNAAPEVIQSVVQPALHWKYTKQRISPYTLVRSDLWFQSKVFTTQNQA